MGYAQLQKFPERLVQPCYLKNIDSIVKNDYFYTKKRQKYTKCTFLGFVRIYVKYKFWYVEYKFWYVKYKFWYVVKYFKVC